MEDELVVRPWTLPVLVGWRRKAFAICWSILLLCCFWSGVVIIRDLPSDLATSVDPEANVGLLIANDPTLPWPTIQLVVGDAKRAGLRAGDRILSVDGRTAAGTAAELDQQIAGPGGKTVTFTAASNGQTARVTVTRDPAAYLRSLAVAGLSPRRLMAISDALFISCYFVLISCALLLMVKRSRDLLAPWASLMMLLFVIGTGYSNWLLKSLHAPLIATYILNGAAYSLQAVVLTVFPTGRFDVRAAMPVAALGVVLTAVAEPLPFAPATTLTLIAQASAFAVVVLRYRTLPPGIGRQQIRWALFGFALSVIALGLSILCLVLARRAESFGSYYWLGLTNQLFLAISSSLLILSLTVSLLRWRLYDADRTISRSLVYGAVTLGLLATFAGSEKLIEIMGEEYLGEQLGALAGALGAAVAAVCVGPLHHRVTRWTEKRFRSELVRLRDGLPALAAELCETKSPAALADIVLDRVEKGLRARHGAVVADRIVLAARDLEVEVAQSWLTENQLLIDGEAAGLQLQRLDPLFPVKLPLRSEGFGLVGWLLLGPRPDGSFYGRDEQDALRVIAAPLARAIATAATRDAREGRRDRDIDGLRELIQDLVARLRVTAAEKRPPISQEC